MTKPFPDTHHDVSSNTIFGFWVYLMTDCILFATFFAAYAVLHNGTFGGATAHDLLDLPSALAETMLLLTSSFTCGIAMWFAPRKDKNQVITWFALTFLLGIAFMVMELAEFSRLILQGNTWQSNAFLSSYFSLIGLHGLHIIAGLLMMIVFVAQLIRRGFTAVVLRRLTCLRMYWQFVYLIWIFTFAIVYLIGAK
jgi:cytochrome o ubiquinol oxidase subunit 3